MEYICEIPLKLPSLNDYVAACRSNAYSGSKMKKQVQNDISLFIRKLPIFTTPVTLRFYWIEENKKRDLDNVAFGKKFILDALVNAGKLPDDSAKWVKGFRDDFGYADKAKVIVVIKEYQDE